MKKKPDIEYLDPSRRSEIEQFLLLWQNDSAYMECQTSGSTGAPVKIKHLKDHMRISASKTISALQLPIGGTVYQCLSTATIGGMMVIIRALENKMRIIIGPVSSDSICLLTTPIDFAAIVPLQLSTTLKNCADKLKLINTVIVGGAPVAEETIARLSEIDITIHQTYGMSETVSHVALRKIGKVTEPNFSALPGITFSMNSSGALCIHYPELLNNLLETNDLVELSDPAHFNWLGRKDFTINSGGVKVQPEKVESVISTMLNLPFFICGLPHPELGEEVTLIIQDKNRTPIDLSILEKNLSRYETPRKICFLDQFVYSNSGKILRSETLKQILP